MTPITLPSGAGVAFLDNHQSRGLCVIHAVPAAEQSIGKHQEDENHAWTGAGLSVVADLDRLLPGLAWVPEQDSQIVSVTGPLNTDGALEDPQVTAWFQDERSAPGMDLGSVAITRGDARFLTALALERRVLQALTQNPLEGESRWDRLRRLRDAARALGA